MSCRSQISHTPITVQYWRIMNKSIFYIEDFLFHNVHLSLFYPLSGTWWLTPQLLLSNCPFLISRYMMSRPFFSHHPTLSVIPPLSLPQPWQAIIPIFCLSISLLLHLAGLMPCCRVSCEGWEWSGALSGHLHRTASAIMPSLCI